jgi:hypothetical protein
VVHVDSLLLMRSRLHPRGAEYDVLHKSLLKGVVANGRKDCQN